MSEFKYQWQVGDKAFYLDKREFRRDVFVVSAGSSGGCRYILKRKQSGKWIKHPDGALIVFQERVNLQPRGKRTIAKYEAAKAKWESEQAQSMIEFRIGDYAASTKESLVFKVGKLKNGWPSDGRGVFTNPTHLRPATPEEIEAHKLSLKTVWSLVDGDKYWSLNHKGDVDRFDWNSKLVDCVNSRDRGLAFLTKEAAEAADQKRVDDVAREKGV